MARNPQLAQHLAQLETQWGVHLPDAQDYLPAAFKGNYTLAMDAQPALVTTSNAGIPSFLTTFVDPDIIKVLLAPNNAAKIFGEVKKGTWLDQTAMFPVVEQTGQVSNYGDYAENGNVGLNTNFPQRQALLYQTIKNYGELEMERAGLAKIAWAAELDRSAVTTLNKFQNLTYFFGVNGLQNYGLLNDPNLSAPIAPGTKATGGPKWINGGVVTSTANEIYTDLQAIFGKLVSQSGGLVDPSASMCLAMSPNSSVALTTTNQFNVSVYDLLKKNFPNIRFETAVQYGAISSSNPQGNPAGNLVQLIADTVEGQDTGYCAFNEKLRAHPVVVGLSSFKQKMTQGSWGAVVRQPFAIAAMVGV